MARAFVAEVAWTDGAFLDDPLEFRGDALDAAWLALRFRALAAVLRALSRPPCRFDRWNAGGGRAPRRPAPPLHRLPPAPGGRALGPYDTS